MPNYQRFQTISAGAQNRFDPDSPVWVSRYRLSLDAESGKRLLQVRMSTSLINACARFSCASAA